MTRDFQFCPYCGNKLSNKFLFGVDRPTCKACDWVYFADPKVAAAVVVFNQGQILLTRRVNEPYRGYWTLPAGFVNAHEDPQAAARRECLEETGLEVEIKELVDALAVSEHDRGADILLVYTACILRGELIAGDDADRAAFFELKQLPPLAFNSTTRILQLLTQNGNISGV